MPCLSLTAIPATKSTTHAHRIAAGSGARRFGVAPDVRRGRIVHRLVRSLLIIAMCLLCAIAGIGTGGAFEVISVPEDVNAVNVTDGIDIEPGTNGRIQLSTAPSEDGIIRRIEVLASQPGTNPN